MITLFTTPKPFHGHIGVTQRNAFRSWKNLWPDVEIIVFGPEEGAAEACVEFSLRHEPHVETNQFGTKRIDWIFQRAQQIARHDFLCYINCDILLLSDFARAFERVRQAHARFLMVGRRWDTPITDSYTNFSPDSEALLRGITAKTGIQQPGYSVDYFLFNKGLYDVMPPLVIGRIWWDHWLVWNARSLGADVVDVSSQVLAIHQSHDYGYHPQGIAGVWADEEAQQNYRLARQEVRLRTIEDASFRLTSSGFHPKRFYFLAPTKRSCRAVSRHVRGLWRTYLWHPTLNVTRPIRHAIGLKRDALTPALRSGERRHWMDQ